MVVIEVDDELVDLTTIFASKEKGCLRVDERAEYNFPDRIVDTELEQDGYLDSVEEDVERGVS